MEVGRRVRAARIERNMTLAALAEASGLTKGFLSQVERGLSNPSLESLGRISSALGLSLSSLLGGNEPVTMRPTAFDDAPRILRNVEDSPDGEPLMPLISGPSGVFEMVRLDPNAVLDTDTVEAQSFVQGFCLVLAGEATFMQNGPALTLRKGDALSWNAGTTYRFENHGRTPASLLVNVAAGGVLPSLSEPVPVTAIRSPYTPDPRFGEDGPMRLVAMRAERRGRRGG